MIRTLGVVEVPATQLGRLASKAQGEFARRRLAGVSLIEWVVRRVTECELLDEFAVVAPDGATRDELSRWTPANIPVLAPETDDALSRLVRAAREFAPRAVVRFRLQHPFVDPVLTDRLVVFAESRQGLDYASYASRAGARSSWTRVGLFGEWCRMEALVRAERLATYESDRREVTRYLYSHSDQFQLGFHWLPAELDREDLRFVLSGEEDWDHAREIIDALGWENWDWRTIAELLEYQPAMRRKMARLNRAEEAATAGLAR